MLNKKIISQIFKFIIVGGIATIIDWICYFLLYNYLNVNPLIANILSFLVSVIYNYIASVKWVFDVNEDKSKKTIFVQFIFFSILGLLLSELILWFGINFINLHAMVVKIIATAIVMIFNFLTRKKFLE